MFDSLRPHGLQHTRLPYPSLSPRICSNSCPLSQWCHPTTSSSVIPFSSCPQSFPASRSLPMSWLFTSGGQSIGASVSASMLPMNLSKRSYVYHWAFRHVLWMLILPSFLSLCCPLAQLSPLPTLSLTFSLRGTFLESFFLILTLVFLLNTPMYCYVRVHFIPPLGLWRNEFRKRDFNPWLCKPKKLEKVFFFKILHCWRFLKSHFFLHPVVFPLYLWPGSTTHPRNIKTTNSF